MKSGWELASPVEGAAGSGGLWVDEVGDGVGGEDGWGIALS